MVAFKVFHLGDCHGQLLLLLVEHEPDGVEVVGEAAVVVGVGHIGLPAQLPQLPKLLLLALHLVPQPGEDQSVTKVISQNFCTKNVSSRCESKIASCHEYDSAAFI